MKFGVVKKQTILDIARRRFDGSNDLIQHLYMQHAHHLYSIYDLIDSIEDLECSRPCALEVDDTGACGCRGSS